MKKYHYAVWVYSLNLTLASAVAQSSGAPKTRAGIIQAEREAKQRQLAPDTPSPAEQRLVKFQERGLLEQYTAGYGGLRLKIGGLATGSGLAAGPEYARNDWADGRIQFRAAALASLRLYQKYDAELNIPPAGRERVFGNLYAVHHNYPSLQYYGPGPDSERTGRSNFRLEDTAFDGTFGVRPIPQLIIAGSSGYLRNNVGPGTDDRFISSEQIYSPRRGTIGIDRQTNFFRYGGHVQFDYRDVPGGTRSGGNYFAQYSNFKDQKLERHDFQRLDVELQQYIPFFNQRRVISLRGKTVLTEPGSRQTIPFYMQPVLGGSETLRGFRPFRFYDNNLLLFNGEYRFEVFGGLDMALFADAGKVTRRRTQIDFADLESDVGFGFRFNARNNVFLRFDVGFSHEGFQIWLKFNKVFNTGPYKTSSSQGEF